MKINTLADVLLENCKERPNDTALTIVEDGRQWTYQQLNEEACKVANALLADGVGVQQRVTFLDQNAAEFFPFLYGVAKINAVTAPINWRLAPKEIEYILQNSEARLLLIGEDFIDHLKKIDLGDTKIVVLGDPGDSGHPSFSDWVAGQSTEEPNIPVSPTDTCCQMYTSGTTGLPKGVETTHANVVAACIGNVNITDTKVDSITLTFMPLFHMSGMTISLLTHFSGGETVMMKDANLQVIQASIEKHRITHMTSVPALLKMLIELPNAREIDYSSLEYIFYGGSPITEDVMVRAVDICDVKFMQGYGLTETTGGVTMLSAADHQPGPEKAHLLRSCGRCIPGHELKIVDPETGESKAANEVGEVWVRGPQIMKGYWKNPEATEETITSDGWLRTGDAAYLDEEGYLYIQDRIKQMIISGGENIYPAEVENALMKHDNITDVTVIGIPHEKWGETVLAICVRNDDSLTQEQVIEHCRDYLARYKCPTKVEWRDEIPRNASGKVQKHILREPYWKDQERAVS